MLLSKIRVAREGAGPKLVWDFTGDGRGSVYRRAVSTVYWKEVWGECPRARLNNKNNVARWDMLCSVVCETERVFASSCSRRDDL